MKTSILPPPDRLGLWQTIRRSAPSWLLSLALHAGILGPLCMITWAVVATVAQEPVLNLAPEGAAKGTSGDETQGGEGVGDPGGAAGKGNDNWAVGPRNDAVSIPPLGGPAGQGPWSDLSAEGGGGLPGFEGPVTGNPFGEASGDAAGSVIRNLYGKSTGLPGGGGFGRGGDLVYGTGEGFKKYIGDLRGSGLDVVLVLDATDSMSPYIRGAKQRLQDVLKVLTALVPEMRIGMVAYKDYGDEYGPGAVKALPLSADGNAVRTFLDGIVAGGGGDEPEPIHVALRAATDVKNMKWIGGRKWVIILVGDSTIHASGRKEAFDIAKEFAQRRGTINVVDVGGSGQQVNIRQQVLPDLDRIAKDGGGSAFLLKDEKDFWTHLIVSVYGQRFKDDVDTIIGRVLGKGELTMRRLVGKNACIVLGACLFALAGCDRAPSSSAKRTVVVYTSLDQVFSEPILIEFERQTGIHVAPVYDAESSKTTGLVTRLLASRDRPDCDVFWNNEAVQTQRLAGEGLLEVYRSPAAARFPPERRDPNGFWTGFAARARVLIYNTRLVSEADAPTGLADLTAPRWRGKVAIAVPLFGTTLTHMAYLRHQWGRERLGAWLGALKANGVVLCPGNAAVRDLVASGEKAMGLTDTDDAYGALSAGKPIRIVVPDANGGAVLIPNTVSVVRNCPHPAEARLLVDYLLSAGVEKALAASPSVQIPLATDLADLPTPWREHLRGVACRLDVAAVAEGYDDTVKLIEEKGMDR